MDPAYARVYADLYHRHWWWRAREAMLLRALRRLAPASGFGRILDVGCGDGLLFQSLESLGRPEGVEPDVSLLSPNGPFRDRIHTGPFDGSFRPAHRFGLILMLDVLEHLSDPAAALARAASLLAPSGRIVITVPAFQRLWTRHDEINQHRRRFNPRSLRELTATTGVRLIHMSCFFHWLFPVKLLVKIVEKVWLPRDSRPRVPPTTLNSLFLGISRFEQATWGRLGLPFGSSLFAVCGPAPVRPGSPQPSLRYGVD